MIFRHVPGRASAGIAGGHERFIEHSHTERLAPLIPAARLAVLRDVGHGGPLHDPDGIHYIVEEFLANSHH